MPDDETTETATDEVTETSDTGETETVDTDQDETSTDETGSEDSVEFWKAQARANEKRAKANAKKAQQFDELEDAKKGEVQKALERAETAEKKAAAEMRRRIADTKGVPIGSLTGDTEEDLTASADQLIAWRDQNAGDKKPPPPKRNPASTGGGPKSGASGADNATTDPRAKAAQAVRRLRAGE